MITPSNARRERANVPENRGDAPSEEGLLTWDWVQTRLAASRTYWVCTTRPGGKPHVRPLWGVIVDDALYFDGFYKSGWFRNLQANPNVTVHLEDGRDAVIMEGRAELTTGMELAQRIADAYALKYPPYAPAPDPGGFVLRPQVVFAWREANVKQTATRWIFGSS